MDTPATLKKILRLDYETDIKSTTDIIIVRVIILHDYSYFKRACCIVNTIAENCNNTELNFVMGEIRDIVCELDHYKGVRGNGDTVGLNLMMGDSTVLP